MLSTDSGSACCAGAVVWVVPLPYARSNEIRFEELVGLIPPLSYSLPRWDDLCGYQVQRQVWPAVRVAVNWRGRELRESPRLGALGRVYPGNTRLRTASHSLRLERL